MKVYERSRFAADLGAALTLASNATGILKRLGVDPEQDGAIPRQWVHETLTVRAQDHVADGTTAFSTLNTQTRGNY